MLGIGTAPRRVDGSPPPEGLNVFASPEQHRRDLRTSNMLQGLNHELKRGTRVASLFANEAGGLPLTTAVLAEPSEA